MIEYAVLSIMTICSLTDTEPFYDCSETWEIVMLEENDGTWCREFGTASCAYWDKNRIYFDLSTQFWFDEKGRFSLEHELEHLKCRCNWHS